MNNEDYVRFAEATAAFMEKALVNIHLDEDDYKALEDIDFDPADDSWKLPGQVC